VGLKPHASTVRAFARIFPHLGPRCGKSKINVNRKVLHCAQDDSFNSNGEADSIATAEADSSLRFGMTSQKNGGCVDLKAGKPIYFNLLGGSSSVVEHFLAKEDVAGSNPVSRSNATPHRGILSGECSAAMGRS
jgi:hypothetical protein